MGLDIDGAHDPLGHIGSSVQGLGSKSRVSDGSTSGACDCRAVGTNMSELTAVITSARAVMVRACCCSVAAHVFFIAEFLASTADCDPIMRAVCGWIMMVFINDTLRETINTVLGVVVPHSSTHSEGEVKICSRGGRAGSALANKVVDSVRKLLGNQGWNCGSHDICGGCGEGKRR